MPLRFEILTPRGVVFQCDVRHVRIPGVAGEIGVRVGHLPFMTALRPGVIELASSDGKKERIALSGGYVEVMPDKIVVLAETAETAEQIDLERAKAARKRAQEKLRGLADRAEIERQRAAIERAKARIRAKSGS